MDSAETDPQPREVASANLRTAQAAYWRAYEDRNRSIALALKAGVPITEVAAVTGLSRTTIYKVFRPTGT